MENLEYSTLEVSIRGVRATLAVQRRRADGPTLLSFHGFGSTKEDYADLALHPAFNAFDLIAYDAPGCGASTLEDPTALSIPFLAHLADAFCDALALEKVHITGHSMGGLTALMFAHKTPNRVLSFFNIEGNVAPEDCFLSRQIVEYGAEDDDRFLENFIERVRLRPEFGSALYAASLRSKVQPNTPRLIFASMVDLSDAEPLKKFFTGLPFPKAFVHGDRNRHLSYLKDLESQGVDVIEIAQSGHFPMYSNAPALWAALAKFLKNQGSAP